MKPLVIYHANCTDGFGAAFAAWLKLGDEAEYLPMEYLKNTDGVAEFHERVKIDCSISERDVYILDFSLPKAVMEWLFAHARRVVWLDHHKTAFEMMDRTPGELYRVHDAEQCIILDNYKSGALLAWEYFHPGTEVPMLIQHIDDRDRWQFKLDGSKEIHAALASLKPWTFDQWWRLFYDKHGLGTDKRADLIQEGKAILRAHNQHVQSALKQARACEIWSFKPFANAPGSVINGFIRYSLNGLAANAPAFLASDLGHELANKSGTFGLVWSMAGDGQIHCSLRSNGDYDVSTIAKAFGGGGHRNAAGFSTDIDTLLEWLK